MEPMFLSSFFAAGENPRYAYLSKFLALLEENPQDFRTRPAGSRIQRPDLVYGFIGFIGFAGFIVLLFLIFFLAL